jgi:archaeal type IV pilus assembly protein PilA
MDESAVSESVGVILIVAVTVILAAVIAAYSFGLVQDIHVERNLVITADQVSPTEIIVTYRGGGSDTTLLTALMITWPDGTLDTVSNPQVGDVYHSPTSIGITPGGDHVIVVGHFTDGKDQVLLNAFI